MIDVFTKDATAELDYPMDWSTWCGTAELITTYAVTVDSSLLTISSHSRTSNTIQTWLSGGTVGQNYTVSIKIVTDASRTDKRSFMVKIRER